MDTLSGTGTGTGTGTRELSWRRWTLGLIYPGAFKFDTGAPERMEITAGNCRVKLAGENAFKSYGPGSRFDVPGKSHFEIAVEEGIAQYVCSFLG